MKTEEMNYKALYEQLLEDFESALHYAKKNNNVCNFCVNDCGEGGCICKGREENIYCTPKWRGIRIPQSEGGCENAAPINGNRKFMSGEEKAPSPYEATVEGMLSPDYKERFKAEYHQTKIRYEKLKAFCNRIEAAMRTCPGDTKRIEMPPHDCPLELLRDQQRAMGEYLHCLEIRAVIEGIELTEV
jgi:hypothetical protein